LLKFLEFILVNMPMKDPLFTIAAVSDIHVEKYVLEKEFFESVNEKADLFLVGGDISC